MKIIKLNLKIFRYFDRNGIGSLPRIFVCSLILFLSFYSMPKIIQLANDTIFNTDEFQNKSKQVLAYTLSQENNGIEADNNKLNEKDLLIDIFSLNDLETDTVRLDASTIKQLFEDTDYKLRDVREKKLVKPVALTLLPQEIKKIENTTKRKEFFIQIVLPLILKENNNIKLDRKRLFSIINKNNNTKLEKKWLEKNINSTGYLLKIYLL